LGDSITGNSTQRSRLKATNSHPRNCVDTHSHHQEPAHRVVPHDSRLPKTVFLVSLIFLTLLEWAILVFRLPVFTIFPGWFWAFMNKPWGNIPAFFLILAPASTILLLMRLKVGNRFMTLALMVLSGYCIQLGFALLEGRGIDGMRDRIVTSGHAEFAVDAVRQESIWSTMSRYEELVREYKLGIYAASKPPGQLLLYMVTERAGNSVSPKMSVPERLDRVTTFASFVWPFLSYLVIFPLFVLGRIISDDSTALRACALYLFIPSVALVTLHTDQVFFPLFAVLLVLLALQAFRSERILLGFLLGAALYCSLFFSFGLLALLPLIAIIGAWLGYERRDLKRMALIALAAVAGIIVTDLLFRFTLNYDIVVRFEGALRYHEAWKNFIPGSYSLTALANLVELGVWLGAPVALLCLFGIIQSAIGIKFRSLTLIEVFSIAFAISLLGMDLLGGTKAEAARLWIFVVPFACLIAISQINRMYGNGKGYRAFVLLLILQLATTYLIKVNQDFW
jgi:hypothetical protein